MTTAPDFMKGFGAHRDMSLLRGKWIWILALGVVYVVAGLCALGSVVTATVAGVLIVGAMMTLAGVAEVISAFQVTGWGSFFLWLLVGILYVVGGFAAFENPLLVAAVLTLLLGVALVASAIMRFGLALSLRPAEAWGWIALSAVVTFAIGVIILSHWPVSSLYVLGIFLGINLVITGAGWIKLALDLKRLPAH